MGVWGTAIFSDDTARDVRGDYQDLLGDGLTGVEATERLLEKWSRSLQDPDESTVFWLALAATQWKCGRLEPRVLHEALKVIDNGTDLARWDAGSADYKKRQIVLQKMRTQLRSPQPQLKLFRKRYRDTNEWEVGDLVSYRLLSSRFIIFRIIGHHTDKGGKSPICEVLDWIGEEIPEQETLRVLGVLKSNKPWENGQLMLGRTSAKQRPDARLTRLTTRLTPSQTPRRFSVINWKWLDRILREDFGLD